MANLKAQITDGKDESTKRAEAEILQLTADIYSLKVRIALSVARAAVLQLVTVIFHSIYSHILHLNHRRTDQIQNL